MPGFGFELLDHLRSMLGKFSIEISRSWLLRISTKRDMCVPLKLCGRPTYMLNTAMVCWTPPSGRGPHRVTDRLDADAVDGDLPGVGRVLHVRHEAGIARLVGRSLWIL